MKSFIDKRRFEIVLGLFIFVYTVYFSLLTIFRMHRTMYASYFDLGIMHQTVFNTYRAIATGDMSRFFELTNPFGPDQITRMAIHNDIALALLAPFYFIHPGPETLLVIQTIVLALGAVAIYKIAIHIFSKNPHSKFLALTFSFAYLLYPPMQKANIYDFHAVVLSTTFLLWMVYFFLKKRYGFSILFLVLSLLTKEQVALTTLFFGGYIVWNSWREKRTLNKFGLLIVVMSTVWFLVSIKLIIPFFRGSEHFALKYYDDFSESITKNLIHTDSLRYLLYTLGPLGFLSFLSPSTLAVSIPEFAINLLSSNWNMRNIIYHYTAVLQPFIFLSAIYGGKKLLLLRIDPKILAGGILMCSLIFSFIKGPLPYSLEKNIAPFLTQADESKNVHQWQQILKSERLKISTTGQLAPFFTNRRYFYTFSQYYPLADYVLVRLNEVYNYPEKDELIPVYERLRVDPGYQLVFKEDRLEVYKKLN